MPLNCIALMGFTPEVIGKYQLGITIGEGTFSKVKLAVNTVTRKYVAIKIIDKQMVMQNKLMYQVKREISTMRLLQHPNIVRIYEVIATKKKIYIVMEYISGGPLSDKMSYLKSLKEEEARKYFHQLIDAVDYCHQKGVYHRDLKPENLLLDGKGNLKVSDFGLCTLRKPGDLISTVCGSPCYLAPEVFRCKKYDGEASDIWSCGVILFELLAGFLPFDDSNFMQLCRKISRAVYKFPAWFTASQRKLLCRILDPNPRRRITLAAILKDEWFQTNCKPSETIEWKEHMNLDGGGNVVFGALEVKEIGEKTSKSPSFINAFQLIAMSRDLDLSGLFVEQDVNKQIMRLVSEHPINETLEKIEVAAKESSLLVTRMNSFKVKIHKKEKLSRSYFNLSAEVIEVTPTHCVVEVSNSMGELKLYKEFHKNLSRLLMEKRTVSSAPITAISINDRDIPVNNCFMEEARNIDNNKIVDTLHDISSCSSMHSENFSTPTPMVLRIHEDIMSMANRPLLAT